MVCCPPTDTTRKGSEPHASTDLAPAHRARTRREDGDEARQAGQALRLPAQPASRDLRRGLPTRAFRDLPRQLARTASGAPRTPRPGHHPPSLHRRLRRRGDGGDGDGSAMAVGLRLHGGERAAVLQMDPGQLPQGAHRARSGPASRRAHGGGREEEGGFFEQAAAGGVGLFAPVGEGWRTPTTSSWDTPSRKRWA